MKDKAKTLVGKRVTLWSGDNIILWGMLTYDADINLFCVRDYLDDGYILEEFHFHPGDIQNVGAYDITLIDNS